MVEKILAANPAGAVFDSAGKYGAGLALEELGRCLGELKVDPDKVLISNKLAWKRVPLKTPEPTFEPGAWVNLKHSASPSSNKALVDAWTSRPLDTRWMSSISTQGGAVDPATRRMAVQHHGSL